MKKTLSIVIILTTLVLTTSAFGQTNSDSIGNKRYVYCELSAVIKALSQSINVVADYGEKTKGSDIHKIKDPKTGKPREFSSIVEALNYMSDEGWEVVTAYSNVYSTINSGTSSNCTYLLRKIKGKR